MTIGFRSDFFPSLIPLYSCLRKYLAESFKSESRSEAKDNERGETYGKDHVRRREDPPICYRLLVPQSSPSLCQHASTRWETSHLSFPFPGAERRPANAAHTSVFVFGRKTSLMGMREGESG